MTEDKNGPESSRLLDNALTTNPNHTIDLGNSILVDKKSRGVCNCHEANIEREEGGGGGGDDSVCLEMETKAATATATANAHIPIIKTSQQPDTETTTTDTTTTTTTATTTTTTPTPRDNSGACVSDSDPSTTQQQQQYFDDSNKDLEFHDNCCTKVVERVHSRVCAIWRRRKRAVFLVVKLAVLVSYAVYFVMAMLHQFGDEGSVTLLVITLCAAAVWGVRQAVRRTHARASLARYLTRWRGTRRWHRAGFVWKWLTRIGAVVFMVVFLMVNVWSQNPENLQSLLGILAFIAFLFVCSNNPSKINWHTVFWAVIQQMILGVIILRTQWGLSLFEWVGRAVKSFLDFGLAGAKFLFGQEEYKFHKVAIITVSIMVYFNAFIASLFHLGVVQAVINSFGRFLGHCLGTGPIESFAASANIFISMTETPLVLRPYLAKMTRAELHAVMTCGFASISGAVLGAYAQYGVPANHLLAASVMSAPAALAASRLLYPETKHSKFRNMDCTEIGDMRRRNVWEAASRGAGHAGGLALAALTSQLAFVSLLALTNGLLQWMGDRVGVHEVTFKWLCSYLFYPLVWLMGTRARDCRTVAALLGIKLFGTPIMAYTELADIINNRLTLENYVAGLPGGVGGGGNSSSGVVGLGVGGVATAARWSWQGEDVVLWGTNATLFGGVIDERSEVIALYMLCGFSTITSIGVCLGVLLNLAEERKEDITSMVINTLVAGNFASFLTAAVAGLMINGKPLPS